jgi:hypothetical protein
MCSMPLTPRDENGLAHVDSVFAGFSDIDDTLNRQVLCQTTETWYLYVISSSVFANVDIKVLAWGSAGYFRNAKMLRARGAVCKNLH